MVRLQVLLLAAISLCVAAGSARGQGAQVTGRYLFYSGSCWSSWGANPIAPDKQALRHGPATFANVLTYSRGLNGVFVDIQDPVNGPGINASDFWFVYGNTTTPATWSAAAVPTSVTSTLTSGTTYRVKIVFPSRGQNGAIPTRNWLQVSVLNNGPHIGPLVGGTDDVFYFGLLVGWTGACKTDSAFYVCSNDYNGAYATRCAWPCPPAITSIYDFTKDAQITSMDYNLSYSERGDPITKYLKRITIP